ncbi:hypothetical protein ACMFMG_003242 [Clarireedia jacksonii]
MPRTKFPYEVPRPNWDDFSHTDEGIQNYSWEMRRWDEAEQSWTSRKNQNRLEKEEKKKKREKAAALKKEKAAERELERKARKHRKGEQSREGKATRTSVDDSGDETTRLLGRGSSQNSPLSHRKHRNYIGLLRVKASNTLLL